MTNLQYRQEKIQEKRKKTPFRDFMREIASWRPITFYKTKGLISRYPETDRIGSIIGAKDYVRNQMSDNDYYDWDFGRSFQSFWLSHQWFSVYNVAGCENADYGDMIHSSKNIYLSVISVYNCENILYSFITRENTRNVYNSLMVFDNSENTYQSAWVIRSYNTFYSRYITDCNNMWFSTNCIWCSECINCSDLENKSYCINNINYSKEEYTSKKNEILQQRDSFPLWYSWLNTLWSCASSTNTIWSFVVNSTNVENGYYSYNMNECRNVFFLWGPWWNENMYDMFVGWAVMGNHCYACQWAWNSEHVYCSAIINDSSFLYYCIWCIWCSFCLWCIGLQNASYCIFNKQYTKEERYEKVDEIFWQMERDGTLWEFFPASMNPFYFNDTAAYLIDPSFTKEEVTKLWYLWRDEPIKVDIPEGAVTIKSEELSVFESVDEQWNRKLDEAVCKRVIVDENDDSYRIIPMELEFLQKYWLPLPRKHWLTRMKENFRIS